MERNFAWIEFAAASLNRTGRVNLAANDADDLVKEYDTRFPDQGHEFDNTVRAQNDELKADVARLTTELEAVNASKAAVEAELKELANATHP